MTHSLFRSQPVSLAGARVLVVEDEVHVRTAVEKRLVDGGAAVRAVGTAHEGVEALRDHPDIIVLDVLLPDGSGLTVAEAAGLLRPMPRMIAMSAGASPDESFRLAKLHVERFLKKPFGLVELEQAIVEVSGWIEELATVRALCVGRLGLLEAREIVRSGMAQQAMTIAGGNRTRAAEMLGVSRQAILSAARPNTASE